jgi:hypothetical protein
MGDNTVVLPRRFLLLRGTADWRGGQRKGQERETHCAGAAGMHRASV